MNGHANYSTIEQIAKSSYDSLIESRYDSVNRHFPNNCIINYYVVTATFTNGLRSEVRTSMSGMIGRMACPLSYANCRSRLTSEVCSK